MIILLIEDCYLKKDVTILLVSFCTRLNIFTSFINIQVGSSTLFVGLFGSLL